MLVMILGTGLEIGPVDKSRAAVVSGEAGGAEGKQNQLISLRSK
jgi:hypothetical protein